MASLLAPSVGDAIATNDPALADDVVPESVGLEWVSFGLIGVLVIGVVAGSSEYSNGQLKTSLVAAPHRTRLVVSKAMALLLVTLSLSLVTIPALSFLSQVAIDDLSVVQDGVPASLAWRWLGGVVHWITMAQVGFALGLLMRQSLIPLFTLIISSQLSLVLLSWLPFLKYLPDAAGTQLIDTSEVKSANADAVLSSNAAAVTVAVWVVVLLGVAMFQFSRRDANS